MIIADVNVWLTVMRRDAEHHDRVSSWLDDLVQRGEQVGLSELALSGVVRISTNRRVFAEPSPPELALDFCAELLGSAMTVRVSPGRRHWGIFDRLVRSTRARANQVPDAFHAALALENAAAFATLDRGFARFEGLRLIDPLAESG